MRTLTRELDFQARCEDVRPESLISRQSLQKPHQSSIPRGKCEDTPRESSISRLDFQTNIADTPREGLIPRGKCKDAPGETSISRQTEDAQGRSLILPSFLSLFLLSFLACFDSCCISVTMWPIDMKSNRHRLKKYRENPATHVIFFGGCEGGVGGGADNTHG